jgi:8-amino-3,8-dideoxy-alpha-D-manno-octulosonate transaminase
MRSNKAALRAAIEGAPGVQFRRLADPEGDAATHLVVTLPDAASATAVAADLGTKTLAKSGWHVYSNMEHLRSRRIVSGFASSVADYVADPGLLPATDALLARSITLGIGVVDAGIGSAFGINIKSTPSDIERVAGQFCDAVGRHVH